MRAVERLGIDKPQCKFCDEADPLVLERHHLAGKGYADDAVIVCRNHHRKLSNLQKDHPDKIAEPHLIR